MAHYLISAIVLDSWTIDSVSWFSFPSILTNKYMEITIGKPRLATPEYISSTQSHPFEKSIRGHQSPYIILIIFLYL